MDFHAIIESTISQAPGVAVLAWLLSQELRAVRAVLTEVADRVTKLETAKLETSHAA